MKRVRFVSRFAVTLLLLIIPLALGAQSRPGPSGTVSGGPYSLEMKIITPEQVGAYRDGTPPSEIVLATGETLEEFLAVAPRGAPPDFSVPRTSVSSGGESESNDGKFRLRSTIGQPVTGASESTDGALKLDVGFQTPDTRLFDDGFESGDTSNWDAVVGEP